MFFQSLITDKPKGMTYFLAIGLGLAWIIFMIMVDPRTLWGDQYFLLKNYQEFIEKDAGLATFWEPKGGHRIPGYYLWFTTNVRLTGFNPLMEIIPSILVFVGTVIYLIRSFALSLNVKAGLLILFSLAGLLVFLNGQNLTLSVYSLVAMRLFNFSLFILLVTATYNYLSMADDRPVFSIKFWTFLIIMLVAIPLFGRGWGVAAGLTLLVMMGIWLFTCDAASRKVALKRILLAGGLIIVTLFIYLKGVTGLKSHSISQGFEFSAFVDFYLKRFGSANLAMVNAEYLREISNINADLSQRVLDSKSIREARLTSTAFKFTTYMFSISYLVVTAIITLWTLRKKEISKAHWLALFILYFPLVATFVVAMSRYKQPAFVIRHNFELSVGLAAILYFAFLTLANSRHKILKALPIGLGVLIIAGSGWTLLQTYQTNSHWKELYSQRALYVQKSVKKGATKKDYAGAHCLNARARKNKVQRCKVLFRFIRQQNIMPSVIERKPKAQQN